MSSTWSARRSVAGLCETTKEATSRPRAKRARPQVGLRLGVERRREVVEDEQLGFANKHPRRGGPLDLTTRTRARKDEQAFERNGRYGAVMGTEGILGTNMMPGVFAQAGMEYAYNHDGVGFEQFAKVAEKNHTAIVVSDEKFKTLSKEQQSAE
jgi:hypothetical protein